MNAKDDPKDADQNYTVVLVDDDGKIYMLRHSEWTKNEVKDPRMNAEVKRLAEYGVQLALLPNVNIGPGIECTMVNIKSILKGAEK